MDYEYDPRIETVARAIAQAQGWRAGDETFDAIRIPNARALEFWRLAVAAVEAIDSFDQDAIDYGDSDG